MVKMENLNVVFHNFMIKICKKISTKYKKYITDNLLINLFFCFFIKFDFVSIK
jgi:hypothetical protein